MSTTLTSDQVAEIVTYVNAYRAKNQSPPIMWDDTIHNFSQTWAISNIMQSIHDSM